MIPYSPSEAAEIARHTAFVLETAFNATERAALARRLAADSPATREEWAERWAAIVKEEP